MIFWPIDRISLRCMRDPWWIGFIFCIFILARPFFMLLASHKVFCISLEVCCIIFECEINCVIGFFTWDLIRLKNIIAFLFRILAVCFIRECFRGLMWCWWCFDVVIYFIEKGYGSFMRGGFCDETLGLIWYRFFNMNLLIVWLFFLMIISELALW